MPWIASPCKCLSVCTEQRPLLGHNSQVPLSSFVSSVARHLSLNSSRCLYRRHCEPRLSPCRVVRLRRLRPRLRARRVSRSSQEGPPGSDDLRAVRKGAEQSGGPARTLTHGSQAGQGAGDAHCALQAAAQIPVNRNLRTYVKFPETLGRRMCRGTFV